MLHVFILYSPITSFKGGWQFDELEITYDELEIT